MAAVTRERFNWEEAVKQDRDLKRIDAFVKLTVSKCPGQLPPRTDASRGGSRYEPAADPVVIKAEQRTFLMVFLSHMFYSVGPNLV